MKKHLNILTSVAHIVTKTLFYFGGTGQFTDTVVLKYEMFWVIAIFCRHVLLFRQSSDVPANSFDSCIYRLENVKTVSKNVPK